MQFPPNACGQNVPSTMNVGVTLNACMLDFAFTIPQSGMGWQGSYGAINNISVQYIGNDLDGRPKFSLSISAGVCGTSNTVSTSTICSPLGINFISGFPEPCCPGPTGYTCLITDGPPIPSSGPLEIPPCPITTPTNCPCEAGFAGGEPGGGGNGHGGGQCFEGRCYQQTGPQSSGQPTRRTPDPGGNP